MKLRLLTLRIVCLLLAGSLPAARLKDLVDIEGVGENQLIGCGVVVGSLALMGVVAWQLGRAAIVDVPTLVIAIVSTALLLRFRVNSAWLIVTAGAFGWLYRG